MLSLVLVVETVVFSLLLVVETVMFSILLVVETVVFSLVLVDETVVLRVVGMEVFTENAEAPLLFEAILTMQEMLGVVVLFSSMRFTSKIAAFTVQWGQTSEWLMEDLLK